MSNKRLIYVDILRILATIAVIVIHVSGSIWTSASVDSLNWEIANFFDSLVRWAVPIFTMISGMLFLSPNKDIKIKNIYFKYIPRIIFSLFIFGIFYNILPVILNGKDLNLNIIYKAILSTLKADTSSHLWFLYLILSLYIITPTIRVYIKNATLNDIIYFLIIWFVFSGFLTTLVNFKPFTAFTNYLDNLLVTLDFRYIGFYILGYYLSQINFKDKTKYIIYYLGILCALFTIIGTSIISEYNGKGVQFFYSNFAPNVIIMSISLFVFCKYKFGFLSHSKVINLISNNCFGIYLIHILFINLFKHYGLAVTNFNPVISIPIITILVFISSFVVTYILRKIPIIKNIL